MHPAFDIMPPPLQVSVHCAFPELEEVDDDGKPIKEDSNSGSSSRDSSGSGGGGSTQNKEFMKSCQQ